MIHLNLGSNLNSKYGSRFDNITIAINLLIESKIEIKKISKFYETPSYPNQLMPKFLNVGLLVHFQKDYLELLKIINLIQKKLGRKKILKEFRVANIENYKEGNEFGLEIFKEVKFVDIRSKTIGKGFAGAMKRHNFSGLRATHGVSVSHRSHGSTGQRQDPGKVFKNKKMAGHMGDKLRTIQNIEVVKSDLENNLLYLKGSIPGSKNTEVLVKKSAKNIKKLTILEKIEASEKAKKIPDKKKK